MIPIANKKTRDINSFIYVPIPSPRDMFMRYGARTGSEGVYLADSSTINNVAVPGSTIGACIKAQDFLQSQIDNKSH